MKDRQHLGEILRDGLVAHVAVVRDGHPQVLPTAFGYDLHGDDPHGILYLHGSSGSPWMHRAAGNVISVAITKLDGLVVARSAFHHSMNYRSAVIIGTPRPVNDRGEKTKALDLIIDHMIPGRAQAIRGHTTKELEATAVLALSLFEASVKVRSGGPSDDPHDVEAGGWGGHIPLRQVTEPPVPDARAVGPVPEEVRERAARSGSESWGEG